MRLSQKLKKFYFLLLPHYEIVSRHTREVTGCTCGKQGQRDVLAEEPGVMFRRVARKKCACCSKNNSI